MRPDYVDVLIVTALPEERFLLDRVFGEAFRGHFTEDDVDVQDRLTLTLRDGANAGGQEMTAGYISVRRGQQDLLRVAWTDLGGAGNVWAYDETSELLELLSPRFVLLVGLAGGNPKTFRRGDVGYSTDIGNSSYSKIDSESLSECIRGLAKKQKHAGKQLSEAAFDALKSLGMKPSETEILNIEIRTSEMLQSSSAFIGSAKRNAESWQTLAQQWRDDFKSQFREHHKSKKYPSQKDPDNNPPKCVDAVVASGDAVVASLHLQEKAAGVITSENKRRGVHDSASLSEMESYGVGLCCKRRNTAFGMLKGVSDLAGSDKRAGARDKDAFRLAAIASSSALAFRVICDETFISGITPRKDRCAWSHTACIAGDIANASRCWVSFKLPDEQGRFLQERPCNAKRDVRYGRELFGTRLIEDVTSRNYSQCVEEILGDAFERLVLMFPYSTDELLAFFYAMPNDYRSAVEKIRSCVSRTPVDRPELVREIVALGKRAYDNHPHFSATNEKCAEWIQQGMNAAQIAKKICRVMCIQESHLADLGRDPVFLLHIFMCGLCVPTFLASQTAIDDYGSDEATIVSLVAEEAANPPRVVTRCLKYSDRGRTLSVIGSCEQRPAGGRQSKAHSFAEEVTRYVNKSAETWPRRDGAKRFEVFPVLELLRRHGIDWGTEPTLVPVQLAQTDRCRAYFAELAQAEKLLG